MYFKYSNTEFFVFKYKIQNTCPVFQILHNSDCVSLKILMHSRKKMSPSAYLTILGLAVSLTFDLKV